MALKLVTDESVLNQLNSGETTTKRLRPVTDENTLRQLNSDDNEESYAEKTQKMLGVKSLPLVNPLSFINDFGIGVGKTGESIAHNYLGSKAAPLDWSQFYLNKNRTPQNEVAENLGGYAPFGVAGGASLLGQGAAGAAYGATQTESDKEIASGYLPKGKVGGAIESALINMLTHGAFKGIEGLRPSKILRGNLSPEELEQNLEITKGTETGLGDVIESPFLKKRLENTLSMLPFSGASDSMQRTGKEVVTRGEKILSDMLGDKSTENVPEQVANDLNTQFEQQRKIKNSLYDEFNEEADKQFLDLRLPRFSSKAKEYKDAIESTNILKLEPGMKGILAKLGIYENPVEKIPGDTSQLNQFGEKIIGAPLTTYKFPTAKEANLLKGKLNEYKNMYKSSPETNSRTLSKIFGDLHSALKEDIQEAVKNSGNPRLMESYENAESNYKKNFSKFLDKEIYKYIGGNKNPEQIVNDFIKTSPNADLANRITKISNTLTPETRSSLAYSYLSKALDNEGNLNPTKLGTAIEKLKPNQFKALIPDPTLRKKLKDYSKLQYMNKESQHLMFNPNTGQRTTDVLMTALLGAIGHISTGGLGGLIAPSAAIGAGRLATKALTNEKLRENLVRKMLDKEPMIAKPKNIQGTQTLAQVLASVLGQ